MPKLIHSFNHAGKRYTSIAAACRDTGVNRATAYSRWHLGLSVEEIFSKTRRVGFHLGLPVTVRKKTYPSIAAACKAHNQSLNVAHARRRAGWTDTEAVEVPVGQRRPGKASKVYGPLVPVDVADPVRGDKSFGSIASTAKHYGLSPALVHQRRRDGWELTRALGLPPGCVATERRAAPAALKKSKKLKRG